MGKNVENNKLIALSSIFFKSDGQEMIVTLRHPSKGGPSELLPMMESDVTRVAFVLLA